MSFDWKTKGLILQGIYFLVYLWPAVETTEVIFFLFQCILIGRWFYFTDWILYSFLAAPGPPLPRPVLPRDRGYMDRVVEYLVGDGPNNRYALICRQCQSHNGMALKEEFEYIGRYFDFRFRNWIFFRYIY